MKIIQQLLTQLPKNIILTGEAKTTDSSSGIAPPDKPVPAPRVTTGVLCVLQIFNTCLICSTLWGQQLLTQLPKNIILTGEENTRPFECDGLSVYQQKPLAVVLPQSVEQIKQVLKICKTHNTPVVTRGAGTGLV
jgi:hypothetical protein